MSNQLKLLGEAIVNNKDEIAREVHEDRLKGVPLTEEQKKNLKSFEQTLLEVRANFILLFGQALIDHEDKEKAANSVVKWGEENGAYLFNLGTPLDEALKDTSYYRNFIWKAIRNEALKNNMPASTVFEVIDIIDPLLDKAVYYFSLTYVKHFQEAMVNAKNAFLELSVPVVPLVQGVGILPLIGNIDTDRARLLMEKTLDQAGKLNLTHLILDVSGVLIVDTMVADQLLKVVEALRLIGVKTIMTGIRPEVAQTIVNLGIKLEHLSFKTNLHQAFKELQLLQR